MYKDIRAMHSKFGVDDWVVENLQADNVKGVKKLLDFRINTMLAEEFTETQKALQTKDAEEIVDGLIDVIVIALGTLDILDVDVEEAWGQVMKANLSKEVGVKPERPNPLNLPDLVKPDGWIGPVHSHNTGLLPLILDEE